MHVLPNISSISEGGQSKKHNFKRSVEVKGAGKEGEKTFGSPAFTP